MEREYHHQIPGGLAVQCNWSWTLLYSIQGVQRVLSVDVARKTLGTLSSFYKKYVYKKPEAEIPNFMYYRLRKLLNKGLRLNKIPTFLYKQEKNEGFLPTARPGLFKRWWRGEGEQRQS